MNGKFGEFIAEKRKSRGLTLRGLAAELGIVPAYMSDIEKGNRYPPDKDKLYGIGPYSVPVRRRNQHHV